LELFIFNITFEHNVLTSLAYDTKDIEKLILNGNYEDAAEEIFKLIEYNRSDKELLYKSLSLLNLICDKSPSISLKAVKNLELITNDHDSWIRLITLEILYQVSMYRPNLLIDLLDKIRARLFDHDTSVRRLAVKIIGNLILSLYIDLDEIQDLIEEFTERLMDNDWKVKLHVINTLKDILNQDYTKIRDLEPLLSIVIVNLRDEDNDVARAAAELLRVLGTYFLSKDKIIYVLLNLLYNEKPRVKELIIWLFGEIGKEKSSEIIPIIPILIKLFGENGYRIQLKVIDALVNIAENNFDQIWSNLINSLDTSDSDYRNNLINALYHLGQKYINNIFSYLFEELENPSENIRESIALVFKRLFEEYQIEIKNEITRIIYKLESKFWRERKKVINLLQNICFILKNQKIAVWITIELNKALVNEIDPDVKAEIIYSLTNIKSNFKDIDNTIKRINEELSLLQRKINEFQKIPAEFRKKLTSYISEFKFNDTEIQLSRMYNRIIKKIKNFNRKINEFEYRSLAFDLIEEWEATKIQIIDEISIVKGFIAEIYEEKKSEFLSNLETKIGLLDDRINVLRIQFDYIKEYSFNINLDAALSEIIINTEEDLEEKFAYITQIRKNLFKLDVDIRDLMINNIEFNDRFKELLRKWITTKIEIQEYLSDMDRQVVIMKEKIVSHYETIKSIEYPLDDKKIKDLSNVLAFQILQGHIQSIISEGIEVFKSYNDKFNKLSTKLEYLIKKNEFAHVKKLLKMKSTQIRTFIEETDSHLEDFIGKEKIYQDNNIFNMFIRPYINKWNDSKELLINKSKKFIRKHEEKLFLSQIKYYMKIMNPIKVELLSSYIGLDVERLKEIILKFISRNKLNVKIINNSIYSQTIKAEIPNSKDLLFFKNIKIIANKIYLYFKLSNPSNYNFNDLQISLKVPTYLKFLKKESFPKFLHLDEIKPGSIFKFNYVLKIQKEIKKNLSDPSVDEIKLDLYYKDPFNINRRTTKKIDLLLQI